MAPRKKHVITGRYRLEKYRGKGGWIYLTLPDAPIQRSKGTSWVIVDGNIDGFAVTNFKIWAMKEGGFFVPVKAAIRKAIGKEAGDDVSVTFYGDEEVPFSADDFMACLKDEPRALKVYSRLNADAQQAILQKIESAANDTERVKCMADAINLLVRQAAKKSVS
jgi:hypothetical protein